MKLHWEDKYAGKRKIRLSNYIGNTYGVGLESLLKYKEHLLCAISKSEQEIDNLIILRWC